jgi:hypothetical protein
MTITRIAGARGAWRTITGLCVAIAVCVLLSTTEAQQLGEPIVCGSNTSGACAVSPNGPSPLVLDATQYPGAPDACTHRRAQARHFGSKRCSGTC